MWDEIDGRYEKITYGKQVVIFSLFAWVKLETSGFDLVYVHCFKNIEVNAHKLLKLIIFYFSL